MSETGAEAGAVVAAVAAGAEASAASGGASLTSTAAEAGAGAAGAATASVVASPAAGASAAAPSIDGRREAMSGAASSSSSSAIAPSSFAPAAEVLGFFFLSTFFFVPRWERCEGESSRAFVTAFVFSAGGMTELLRVGEARHGNWPIETACLLVGGRRSRHARERTHKQIAARRRSKKSTCFAIVFEPNFWFKV